MDYSIRLAMEHDIEGLCKIRNNPNLFKKYFAQQESKNLYVAIAEQNRTILGFGLLKLKGNLFPKLSDLYVHEEARGNGIGSALITFREKLAISLGYTEMYVSVDPIENPKMIKLITKLGYQSISDPYEKTAIYYNNDGSSYEKTYTRVDLKKLIDNRS
ncbi:GNAT family N-acetyltransferase [Fredinandcohnia sp. 179-A 10B2 NHS]|uniref:GNAT family N-acetyltransferase n=1 Tax=Fredinandcohnia sp. 179-A 10B2 NHS TaxID=3235176 RepID=UPI0039A09B38